MKQDKPEILSSTARQTFELVAEVRDVGRSVRQVAQQVGAAVGADSPLADVPPAIRDAFHRIEDEKASLAGQIADTRRDLESAIEARYEAIDTRVTGVEQELRRELVGLWDETAAIQAKLADLYSTETTNLLRRLGYDAEDIEEYIWAVSHLSLDISLDDLHRSANAWEAREDRGQKVAPKWTAEMEAGELSPTEMLEKYFSRAQYLPHITTGRGFWNMPNTCSYAAGLHATAPTDVILNKACSLGSFTGMISRFKLPSITMGVLKKFKSDMPVVLECALIDRVNLDLENVDVSNATNLWYFAPLKTYFGQPRKLPAGFENVGKDVPMQGAFGGNRFVDETIDLRGRTNQAFHLFSVDRSYSITPNKYHSALFENCEIDMSASTDADVVDFTHFGYLVAANYNRSTIKAHGHKVIDPRALVSPHSSRHEPTCGVWEVDCPDAEDINTENCPGTVSATFWNLGRALKNKTLLLKNCMRAYYSGGVFYGIMNEPDWQALRDSFRKALRTWVAPAGPCTIVLYSEQYDVLSEEDIALITEKGYTIVVDDNIPTVSNGAYKLEW